MKTKSSFYQWICLATGVLLLVNASSRAGFFPSGHGPGRVPEIITGAFFVLVSAALFLTQRRRAKQGNGSRAF